MKKVSDETRERFIAEHGEAAYERENAAVGACVVKLLKQIDGYTLAASGNAALMLMCAVGVADDCELEVILQGVREAWTAPHVRKIAEHIRGRTAPLVKS